MRGRAERRTRAFFSLHSAVSDGRRSPEAWKTPRGAASIELIGEDIGGKAAQLDRAALHARPLFRRQKRNRAEAIPARNDRDDDLRRNVHVRIVRQGDDVTALREVGNVAAPFAHDILQLARHLFFCVIFPSLARCVQNLVRIAVHGEAAA